MNFSRKIKAIFILNTSDIFSVSQLTAAIKQKLEKSFAFVAVRGEVSNLRRQASGHIYFTLKDKESQISAVLFRGNAMHLSQLPKEGDQLTVKGELSVYPPRGNYQIIVRDIEFSGIGQLLKKLHDRKLKLQALGWFDSSRKKPLPKLPRTIGVVTSPTGSVIQDILHILNRRFSGFHLLLNPVRVQGEGAASEIAKAITDFNQHHLADVLIVGRGGGSLEDLWPFNEEIVAKAIYASHIPIISAVGHETDFTIADFVADVRAPTPSAAAEIVTLEKKEQLVHLSKAKTRILQTVQAHLRIHRKMLEALSKHPSLSSPDILLGNFAQKIDEMRNDLSGYIQQILTQYKLRLYALTKQKEALKPSFQMTLLKQNFHKKKRDMQTAMKQRIALKRERLRQLTNHLSSIDPHHLLKKGYSIVFREKKDSVILSINDVDTSENLRIKLSEGQLLVSIKDKI